MQIIFWENSIGPYANLVAIQAILIETVNYFPLWLIWLEIL